MSQLRACIWLLVLLSAGCHEQRMGTTLLWSEPQEVGKSHDSLSTSFTLYRWHDSLVALGGDAGTWAVRLLADDGKSWRTASVTDPGWIPMDVDPNSATCVVARGTLWSNRLEARFGIGTLSASGQLVSEFTAALPLSKATLFPNAEPNLEMEVNDRPAQVAFAGGVVESANIRVPYSIRGTPIERHGHQVGVRADLAVCANGVFASSDGGRTWHTEPVVTRYAELPVLCRTRAFYYYFAKAGRGGVDPYELWYARCPVESSAWSAPQTLNKSVARKLSESLHALGEQDTVHLCWLDARHKNTRFSATRPLEGNFEVAYCHRRDADAAWSKEVILSKGLRWAYAPSIAVEGNQVVVAWAGTKSDRETRNEWNASDIYCAFSKDGGVSWTRPLQVTDSFKSGITSGRPQVALHQGVIHLFYIQGKLKYQEVSAGLVMLNQPPWPILYQQGPFPQ